MNDRANKLKRVLLVPRRGRMKVPMGAILDLLVEGFNLIFIIRKNNFPPRKALGIELKGLVR